MLKKLSIPALIIISFFGIILLSVTRCVDEYNPNLNENERLLSIDGSIIREQEEQSVVITMSSPVDSTQFNPVNNCTVFITDDQNNVFPFEEKSDGKYSAKIDISYLNIGAKFKLTVETPDKNIYESGFEEILESVPVDSLYFLEETNYSNILKKEINGLRLYVDLKANKEYTPFYRWKISETWEYRSAFYIDEIYDWSDSMGKEILKVNYKKDTLQRCWKFGEHIEIYSSSTLNMSDQGTKQIPLHYMFGNDNRLNVKYSCLVSQYSLNEGAYIYWQNKQVEITESGGLYVSQPSQSVSNIKNISKDGEIVLGYFWTSSITQKRVFFKGPFPSWGYKPFCPYETLPLSGRYILDKKYIDNPDLRKRYLRDTLKCPIYVFYNYDDLPPSDTVRRITGNITCFDCRLLDGGTLEKPDFW